MYGDQMLGISRIPFDLGPQLRDVVVHGPGGRELFIPPDFIQELIPGYDIPDTGSKILEDAELLGRKAQ